MWKLYQRKQHSAPEYRKVSTQDLLSVFMKKEFSKEPL